MPFDPNIVRPRIIQADEPPLDEAGDLVLRDDLAELAAQLRDDAAHLASLYPASRSRLPDGTLQEGPARQAEPTNNETAHIARSSRRLIRAIALVAALGGLIIGAGVWWPRGKNQAETPRREVAGMNDVVADLPTAEPARGPIMPAKPPLLDTAPPLPASPALFLHDYSGPELEGLYDLLEEPDDGTISI